MALDLHPALMGVRTFHPTAKGAILLVHDEEGNLQIDAASFAPTTDIELHDKEMALLVHAAPVAAKQWSDQIIAESQSAQQQGKTSKKRSRAK